MIAETRKTGWKMVKFGDVVRQCKEKVDRDDNPFERYVEGGHMDTEDIHIRRWGEFGQDYVGPAFHRIFRKGQVLYGSRRTYLKKVAVAEFDGITANTTFVLETKDQRVFMQELLPFLMLTDRFTEHSIGESKGSTNPYINWPDIAKFEFSLPPIEEQKRITETLWAADETVVRYSDVLAFLETLQGAAMAESFRSSSNGIVFKRAEDICEKVSVGIVVKPASYYVKDGGVPALRSLNVLPGRFDLQDLVHISDEGSKKNRKSELHTGDVVIVRSGRPGDASVVRPEQEGFNAIDLIIARPGENVLPDYLCAFVNSELAKRQFRRGIAGTAQTHFNVGEFKKLSVPVIRVNEQKRLLTRLAMIQEQILEVSKHLQSAQRASKSLLNSAIWRAADV